MKVPNGGVIVFFTGFVVTFDTGKVLLYIDANGDLTSSIQKADLFSKDEAFTLQNSLRENGIETIVAELKTKYGFII